MKILFNSSVLAPKKNYVTSSMYFNKCIQSINHFLAILIILSQSWEFALQHFCSSLFCSRCTLNKSHRSNSLPQHFIAPIALYKKSDMRECCLQEKSDRNNSLFLRVIHFKLVFFTMLFPLVCSKQKSESLKKKRFASVKATRAIHTLKIANSTFPLSFSNNK